MPYRYVLSPLALQDLDDIIDWYQTGKAKTASRFLLEFFNRLDLICANPRINRRSYLLFRKMPLTVFPYQIIYLIDDSRKRLFVATIWHKKRNPKTLRELLRTI